MPLYLFPNLLGDEADDSVFSNSMKEAVGGIDLLVAESDKGGRRFLKRFSFSDDRTFRDIPIYRYNEHARNEDLDEILEYLEEGKRVGLVSDAGLPCIADPGSKIVLACHRRKIPVFAYPGPSSIFLALMLSGLPGQSFCFHGYFPRKEEKLPKLLRKDATHLFIEAPYRNEARLKSLIEILPPKTWLGLAVDLTLPSQQVIVKPVREWKKIPAVNKHPAVYMISEATSS